MKGPETLTNDAAAEYIGVKPQTLKNWRVQKRGPAFVKVGSKVRYLPADLDDWLRGQRRNVPAKS